MADLDRTAGLYPALLKHWRRQRGLSQLDLALIADISARHISFLETGRSTPSAEMVVLLGTTLGVPLRHVNAMLRAAGHDAIYDERPDSLPSAVGEALELLKQHQEPFPLIVIDETYRIRDLNRGALAVLGAVIIGDPGAFTGLDADDVRDMELNLARTTFDPNGAQPFIVNFDEVGRQLLWRIQRETLEEPDDGELQQLLDELLRMPTISEGWRSVDLSVPSDPALVVHLRRDDLDLRFLTMVTAFQAPQNIAVERVQIETWFPYDAATASACRTLLER